MAHAATPKNPPPPVPTPPGDGENPAIIDAAKTFRWTLFGALLFVVAAVFLIMRTRMG
ncbi:MAG: hypothetical protein AB7T31_09295 [Gemmatimonadales bacterium]